MISVPVVDDSIYCHGNRVSGEHLTNEPYERMRQYPVTFIGGSPLVTVTASTVTVTGSLESTLPINHMNTPVTSHSVTVTTSTVTVTESLENTLPINHMNTPVIFFNARDCGSDFKCHPVFFI